MIKLGVDVGGTFTDLVMIDDADGTIRLTKVPSTPASPDQAVLSGLDTVSKLFSVRLQEIERFIHGTTVATNALIERKGVETALIVTEGFRDVLHIGRQTRPKLYDFFARRPDPIVPRHRRFEVPERMLYTGDVKEPLDEAALREVATEIAAREIRVVAVCFLHSYINPSHEERAREILLETIPHVKVCTSCSILPEVKEYERMSTTAINAYVMPIVEAYLQRIVDGIHVRGMRSNLRIMQSNGGLMTAEMAGRVSVHTILSGPAAGVLGAVTLGESMGERNFITVDMGGTSFDVALTHQGKPAFTTESHIDGHVINVPMLDIKTLGAGGGSIASVDAGGALQVGPQSSGADPGPACYGRGGQEPTVTDANLVLGYLNAASFAGKISLNVNLARQAIENRIAKPMGMELAEAAEGILRVVNATMIRGIRLVSIQRGYDPREFALICFGGAGPVHAVKLAQELSIPRVIVPETPGVNCALGLLMADFRQDFSKTFLAQLNELDSRQLTFEFKRLEERATEQMIQAGLRADEIVLHRSSDARYVGQGYEIEVPVPAGDFNAETLTTMSAKYSRVHEETYGYRMSNETVEIVNLRLTAIGVMSKPEVREEPVSGADSTPALRTTRSMFMDGHWQGVPVFERSKLRCGNRLPSPAVIEQPDSTTVVFAGYKAEVDRYRNLVMTQSK